MPSHAFLLSRNSDMKGSAVIITKTYLAISVLVIGMMPIGFINAWASDTTTQDAPAKDTGYAYNKVLIELRYPYKMPKTSRDEFFKKLKTLKTGDQYSAVVKLLGTPYIQQIMAGKERNAPVRGTSLTYYLNKLDDGVNLKHDQYVGLDFDNTRRLARMVLSNVQEFTQGDTKLPVTEWKWNDAKKLYQEIK